MEAFVLDKSRLVSDVIGSIAELKNTFQSTNQPINDDDTTLQRFCVKLETILRHEQKERYSLLGYRKDYWSFIAEGISKDDGVRYVLSVPQVKSAQGKGRCFIRYALVQKTLADTIQRLVISKDSLSSWYRQEAVFRNQSLCTALVNKLYDLNDIEFDLPCGGYDLDISWPAFSRRNLRDVNTSARRNSASSMTSVDFRNERQDPLVGLASEIASLKEFFNAETADGDPEANDPFDNISISASSNMETPLVSELTLKVSHVHQQALKWKATVGTERTLAAKELKKAQEDRQFAIRESELKTKQLMGKYSNLAKSSSNESELKYSQFKEKLSEAEHVLQDRETELRQLRSEVNRSVVESSTAQKSAIVFEKQLLTNDRKIRELESEIQTLKLKLQSNGEVEVEFDLKEKRWKERIGILEAKEYEYKESVSELRGNLRAKEVALESIQESFEKLNGMVFGSFEELEAELKERLLDKEKGLQNQTVENRKLELDLVELQQQVREKRVKLSETKSQLDDLQLSYEEVQHSNLQMEEMLKKRDRSVLGYMEFVNELGIILGIAGSENKDDGDVKKEDIINHSQNLTDQVQSLQKELVQVSEKLNVLEINAEVQERELQQRTTQLESLQVTSNSTVEEVDALKKTQDHLNKEKDSIEEELKAVLSSMEDLQTELSQAKELNDEKDQQLSVYKDDNHRQTELIDSYEKQITDLRNECQDAQNSVETLGLDLSQAQEKVMLVDSENIELKGKLSSLEEELKILKDDKAGLVDEIDVARQQLGSANEGRIRAEHAQVKTHEELENLQCMMGQEVAALKFQLSSETIKFETEKKVLSEQSVESARYKDRSLDQEDVIVDLESKLKERTDGWQNEKRKYVNEIKHLRSEVQLLKNALDGNKQKLMTLENDLLLTTKQRGEERSRQKDMKRKIKEINEMKIKSENDLKNRIAGMEKDMRDLKDKVISLTREKADIWKQADEMAHEISIKASDRWVDDNEVNKCVNCKTEFSFIMRKHHCRLCGRIFCHSCVNNWVKTPHSSKLKRVCDYCLANDKQLKPQKIPAKRHKTSVTEEDFDETMSDVSIGTATRSASSSMLSFNDDEGQATASEQPKGIVSSSVVNRKEDERRDGSPTLTPLSTSSPIAVTSTNIGTTEIENEQDSRQDANDEYLSFANVNSSGRSAVVVSPDPEGFEVIDPNEDICEVTESRVVVSERDQIETLVIPAVNDEQGVSCECSVPAGVRHVIPVMVATPGAILCWSFKTLYKSVIFGLGFKESESLPYEEVETLFPLARYSSNLTPVEGEWKAASHGVYLLVFDNTYSRFTSKQLTCVFHVQRRPPS